jgi:hypothetical protein
VFIWTWIVSAAPHLVSVLLAELVDAWLWTIETGRGLFASGPANSGPNGRLRPHLTPGEPVVVGNKHQIEGIIAHRLWLGFLFDQFEVNFHGEKSLMNLEMGLPCELSCNFRNIFAFSIDVPPCYYFAVCCISMVSMVTHYITQTLYNIPGYCFFSAYQLCHEECIYY